MTQEEILKFFDNGIKNVEELLENRVFVSAAREFILFGLNNIAKVNVATYFTARTESSDIKTHIEQVFDSCQRCISCIEQNFECLIKDGWECQQCHDDGIVCERIQIVHTLCDQDPKQMNVI